MTRSSCQNPDGTFPSLPKVTESEFSCEWLGGTRRLGCRSRLRLFVYSFISFRSHPASDATSVLSSPAVSRIGSSKLTFVKQSRQKWEFPKQTHHNGTFHFHLYFQECFSSQGHGLSLILPSPSLASLNRFDLQCGAFLELPSLSPLSFLPVGSLEYSHSSHIGFLQCLETLCCFNSLFLWRCILNEWT